MSTQQWSASDYTQNASYVSTYGREVVELLAPKAGERILDLGCGEGELAARIAESGAQVVGADTSRELLDVAAARGVRTIQMDGQRLSFEREFDAVFTNAALHWMPDHSAVAEGVRRALKPGGRFAGEFGGHGNVAAICTALLAALDHAGIDTTDRYPWNFPTVERFRATLEASGFTVDQIALIPRPTPLPTDMAGWMRTFAQPFLAGLSDEVAETIRSRASAYLRPSLNDDKGNWTADYIRLRFAARV